MNTDIKKLLENVKDGSVSVDEALLKLKQAPFADIGYAKVDLHRNVRQGAPEVIYGAGTTAEQIIGIMEAMTSNGQDRILITRLSEESAGIISEKYSLEYHSDARIGFIGKMPDCDGIGNIVVATGGTSDIAVAEEAALKAEF